MEEADEKREKVDEGRGGKNGQQSGGGKKIGRRTLSNCRDVESRT